MDFATSNYRCVRVFESTRAQNFKAAKPQILGTVSIGILCVTTRLTNKLGLRLPVCFLRVTTLVALPGGIARIDLDQRDSCYRRLVGKKAPKLREAPTMQPCPFPPSGPDPRPDARQFLDGNSTVRAFCGLDYAFGNCVINVASKVRLSLATFLQKTFGGLRSFALQLAAKGAIAVANLVQMGTGIVRSIGVVGDLYNTHIHPETIHSLNLFVLRHVNSDIQKPLPLAKNQVGLTARISKQGALLFSADKGHLLAPAKRPDAHGGRNQVQAEDAGIIGNTAVFAKDALNFLVQLVGVHDLCVEQTHDLSGQRKLVSNLAVESLVKWKTAKLLRIPSQLREAIGCAVHGFQRGTQSVCLNWLWQQFNLDSQFHFNQCISKP